MQNTNSFPVFSYEIFMKFIISEKHSMTNKLHLHKLFSGEVIPILYN